MEEAAGVRSAAAPSSIRWGLYSAAHQIEGRDDSCGGSIWNDFESQGLVSGGANADVACDHFSRFEQDVKLLANLGIKHYQFSVAWPRVRTAGGLDFYCRLVRCLIEHGIEPVVTLYHWDLPEELQSDQGEVAGWTSSKIVPLFAEYARQVFSALSPLGVKRWITIHDPWSIAVNGHSEQRTALHPPALALPLERVFRVGHNLLLAHAEAVRVFRSELRLDAEGGSIGITLSADWAEPFSDRQPDREAAEKFMQSSTGWFASPLFFGHYPRELQARHSPRLPEFTPEERALVKGSVDFLGVRYQKAARCKKTSLDPTWEVCACGDTITPWALREVLHWLQEQYRPTAGFIVTGLRFRTLAGMQDELEEHPAECRDTERENFLCDHAAALLLAKAEGVDVRGFFAGGFLDCFEWDDGYDYRSGLVYVDFTTRERKAKTSATWFARVAASNTLPQQLADAVERIKAKEPRSSAAPLQIRKDASPMWWVDGKASTNGDAKHETSLATLVPVWATPGAVADPALEALLELFWSNGATWPHNGDAHGTLPPALKDLDPATVLCTVEAVELHLQSMGSGAPAHAQNGGLAPLASFQEICEVAAQVSEKIEEARSLPLVTASQGPLGTDIQAGPQQGFEQEIAPHLTLEDIKPSASTPEQWDEAVKQATLWQQEQMRVLREATGSAATQQYAEVAAVDPKAMAASLLLLESRVGAGSLAMLVERLCTAAPQEDPALQSPEAKKMGHIQLRGPLWRLSTQEEDNMQLCDDAKATLVDADAARLLRSFRGEIPAHDQEVALAPAGLDPETLQCVLEAVVLHCRAAASSSSQPSRMQIENGEAVAVQPRILEIAQQAAKVVACAQAGGHL